MKLSRAVTLSLLGVTLAGGAIAVGRLGRESRIQSASAVIDGTLVIVRTPEAGVLRTEPLAIGTPISAGEPIAMLEPVSSEAQVTAPAPLPFGLSGTLSRAIVLPNRGIEDRLAAAKARLESLRSELRSIRMSNPSAQAEPAMSAPVDLGSYQQAVSSAESEVSAAESVSGTAKKALDKATYLYSEGAVAKREVDRAQGEYERAESEVRSAERKLARAREELAEARNRAEQPAATSSVPDRAEPSARQKQLEAEIRAAEQEVARLRQAPRTISRVVRTKNPSGSIGNQPLKPFVPEEIVEDQAGEKLAAPSTGVVWRQVAQTDTKVAPNQEILRILLSDALWVQASFSPEAASDLRVGGPVSVSLGELTLVGTIESIGAAPHWSSVSQEGAAKQAGLVPVKIKVSWPKNISAEPARWAGSAVVVTLKKD
ncbi:MAG: HlyD family efflux transporter periplasmic adaptor subunit [Fimbriimonadaceae bacterium]|nr:HlyD family efflux transporter periplasmic adaptor subunit [Fimbriimonadaceae bacterium]